MVKASVLTEVKRRLGGRSLFYVCRDAERAAALLNIKDIGYYVITNNSPYALLLARKYKNIITVGRTSATPPTPSWKEGEKQLDTRELLTSAEAKKNIKKNDFVMVFKNTPEIEKICKNNGWRLLNPAASLASEVEEKISGVRWLGPLQKYLPPHKVTLCKNIKWEGKKFILQFNRAHTGSGTILVETKKQLDKIKKKFPRREARVTAFIDGPTFTNNNVVWGNKILTGNINYQITGLSPFTDSPFATVGNDWALPEKILNAKQFAAYEKMCRDIGARLKKHGWRGLFGVDAILDKKTGKLYLIEINARQPASTTYESVLQKQATTFEAHVASLLGMDLEGFKLTKISDGAQIVLRVQNKKIKANSIKIKKTGFNVIEYENTKPGADALRIQSKVEIMAGHEKFNKTGLLIKKLIS